MRLMIEMSAAERAAHLENIERRERWIDGLGGEVGEIPDRPTDRALAARLPRSASGIAAGVMDELDSPKADTGPRTIARLRSRSSGR